MIWVKNQKNVFSFVSHGKYGSKNDAKEREIPHMIKDKELAGNHMKMHLARKIPAIGELYKRKFE